MEILRKYFRLEVEGINILVFFWGILGVLNGSVRALLKPFRVILDVWMIGRTLKCNVERDFDFKLFRTRNELIVRAGPRRNLVRC